MDLLLLQSVSCLPEHLLSHLFTLCPLHKDPQLSESLYSEVLNALEEPPPDLLVADQLIEANIGSSNGQQGVCLHSEKKLDHQIVLHAVKPRQMVFRIPIAAVCL